MTSARKAILIIDGQEPIEFPIMEPVHGNDCIDIRTLGGRLVHLKGDPSLVGQFVSVRITGSNTCARLTPGIHTG